MHYILFILVTVDRHVITYSSRIVGTTCVCILVSVVKRVEHVGKKKLYLVSSIHVGCASPAKKKQKTVSSVWHAGIFLFSVVMHFIFIDLRE